MNKDFSGWFFAKIDESGCAEKKRPITDCARSLILDQPARSQRNDQLSCTNGVECCKVGDGVFLTTAMMKNVKTFASWPASRQENTNRDAKRDRYGTMLTVQY